jgi:uncharacterized protein (DUF433 family)
MTTDLIHDRGRGPELVGTRITVYNLLPYLLDPTATEPQICEAYGLTPEQVAAARAYVLNHAEDVLPTHWEIETRIAAGNAPAVTKKAEEVHAKLLKFQNWLALRRQSDASHQDKKTPFPAFGDWLAAEHADPVGP